MIKHTKIIVLLSLLLTTLSITGVGLNPIRPLQLNKGSSTKYMFYINPEQSIPSNANLQITFPAEFDMTALASNLACQAQTVSTTWTTVPCVFNK